LADATSLLLSSTDVLDSMPDAVLIVAGAQSGGQILYVNNQAARMFAYPREELLAKSIDVLVPQSSRPAHIQQRREFERSPRLRTMGATRALRGRRKDGSEFPIDVLLSPSGHPSTPVTIAVVRDMTERKRLEDELLGARDLAIRANEVKSRFLAAASHDLRQPLQTIWNLHSMLSRSFKDTELAPQIELLEEAVRSMDQMLSALIDINRLERGAIQPVIRDFSLQDILPRLSSEFSYAASSKGIELAVERSNEQVRSDSMLLPVILRNLLGNAIKYTQHGIVKLCVRTLGEQLFIDIVDTGPGIAQDQLQFLFEAFYQIDNPNRDQSQGVGLGLSIVQTICRLLDHTVTIQSQIGQGSTFSVQLMRGIAVDAPLERILAPIAFSAPPPGNLTVLHIEDDPGIARSMAMLLSLEGYKIVGAASRDEAIERVAQGRLTPDLILCDFNLPMGFTGDAIVAEITLLLGHKPPTIILTGDIADQHVRKAMQVAERILPKPVDINLLLQTMSELLAQGTAGEVSSALVRDIGTERPLDSRSDPEFTTLLTASHLHILEDHPQTVYGVWPDFTLAYLNPAWFEFARRNGGEHAIPAGWSIGQSALDAVPECLREWYVALFASAFASEVPLPQEHAYECSSADLHRRFLMKVYPLQRAEMRGFVVINSLRFEVPHVKFDRLAMPPIMEAYVDEAGSIHSCANCRRVQSVSDPSIWHWVPEWIRRVPPNTRPSLCPACRGQYYRGDSRGLR
jgi:PAS domain S-box-containing protein